MFEQKAVGYANTLGWAHPNTGDTMSTIMIGGLRTVMNGDFEVYTGDLLMWYWPFELDCFEPDGKRFFTHLYFFLCNCFFFSGKNSPMNILITLPMINPPRVGSAS